MWLILIKRFPRSCREQVLRLVPCLPSCATPRFAKSRARRQRVQSTDAAGLRPLLRLRFCCAICDDRLLRRSRPSSCPRALHLLCTAKGHRPFSCLRSPLLSVAGPFSRPFAEPVLNLKTRLLVINIS
jgi:hypothetical protein